jgi:hypothetical protein
MVMSRAKEHQPGSHPRSHHPSTALDNGLQGDVLTLPEAAAYLRLPEAEVVRSVQSQGLPGRCIAGEWRFLRSAIQHWLASGSPTWEMRKAEILDLAGKYRDDPDLESIVEDAYRRRGRPITGRGSRTTATGSRIR